MPCIRSKILETLYQLNLEYLFGRLQTGMRGAFGKPLGTVARVNIGQVILSIRSKPQNKAACIEAFRRAKMKFPGRQKVCIRNKVPDYYW